MRQSRRFAAVQKLAFNWLEPSIPGSPTVSHSIELMFSNSGAGPKINTHSVQSTYCHKLWFAYVCLGPEGPGL